MVNANQNIRRSTAASVLIWGLATADAGLAAGAGVDAPFATGVNLAGAEFGDVMPGAYGEDYVFPGAEDFDQFAALGFGLVRLPIRWERLEPQIGETFDFDQLSRLDAAVDLAGERGLNLIIDVHNYARYNEQVIGKDGPSPADFARLWRKLALRYGADTHVVFGLMNEPFDIDADRWAAIAQQALDAVRSVGAQNLVLISGTAWSGAHSWMEPVDGRSNGEALKSIADPCNNNAYEVHQYFDRNSSGTSGRCASSRVGGQRLAAFSDWLEETGNRGFLGEFGAGKSAECLQALDGMLSMIDRGKDRWIGWTYWAAGSWWGDDYHFLVRPADGAGEKQMAVLKAHAAGQGTHFHGCRAPRHRPDLTLIVSE